MKALTLKQPWAHAVAHWGKNVENRTWEPPLEFVGSRIAIHAGRAWDALGAAWIEANRGLLGIPAVEFASDLAAQFIADQFSEFARGAVVATARLTALLWQQPDGSVMVGGQSEADELAASTRQPVEWFDGPIGWYLDDVRPLDAPVPARGHQGLWTLPEGVERAVAEQLS